MKDVINEIVEMTMAILKDQEELHGKTIYHITHYYNTFELTRMAKKLYNKFNKVKNDLDVSVFVLINRLIHQMDIAYLPSVISGAGLYQENFEKLITKCYNLNSIEYKVFIDEVRSEVLLTNYKLRT